jgi:NAD(P)-dependent dehydrogenase (short-subunit alcohol dehydrogenase family)
LGEVVSKFQKSDLDVHGLDVDITKSADVARLSKWVKENWGSLDVLVNNAGVFPEPFNGEASVFQISPELVAKTFETNTLGAMRVTVALADCLKASGKANVVNVSSGMGQLSEMNGSYPAYRLSKTALNALTRIFSEEFGNSVRVNSVCPGWVRTEMGGQGADRSIEEGMSGIVWAATLEISGPTGGFFRDGKPLDW